MIQLYFYKKNFETQKAERWFSERRLPLAKVDLTRTKLGRRELASIRKQVSLNDLIDKESAAWKECPARYASGEDAILDALADDPRRLHLPIVRNGKLATVGYAPEIWAAWACNTANT